MRHANHRRAYAVLGAAALLVSGCAAEPAVEEVRVAAASDLRFALEEVVVSFEKEHPGTEVAVSYGSSGTFAQRIGNGAPFDLYLSADAGYVEDLVADGRVERDTVFHYATGRLAVWAATDSPADPGEGIAGLTDAPVETVAIANPEHAPYGAAAVAAMESAGLHDRLESKLVLGESVSQAAEFARSGNADAGVVALPLALSPGMRDSGSHTEVPPESFPRLRQTGATLPGAPEEAEEMAAFLRSPSGREILTEHGFSPPATDTAG